MALHRQIGRKPHDHIYSYIILYLRQPIILDESLALRDRYSHVAHGERPRLSTTHSRHSSYDMIIFFSYIRTLYSVCFSYLCCIIFLSRENRKTNQKRIPRCAAHNYKACEPRSPGIYPTRYVTLVYRYSIILGVRCHSSEKYFMKEVIS